MTVLLHYRIPAFQKTNFSHLHLKKTLSTATSRHDGTRPWFVFPVGVPIEVRVFQPLWEVPSYLPIGYPDVFLPWQSPGLETTSHIALVSSDDVQKSHPLHEQSWSWSWIVQRAVFNSKSLPTVGPRPFVICRHFLISYHQEICAQPSDRRNIFFG